MIDAFSDSRNALTHGCKAVLHAVAGTSNDMRAILEDLAKFVQAAEDIQAAQRPKRLRLFRIRLFYRDVSNLCGVVAPLETLICHSLSHGLPIFVFLSLHELGLCGFVGVHLLAFLLLVLLSLFELSPLALPNKFTFCRLELLVDFFSFLDLVEQLSQVMCEPDILNTTGKHVEQSAQSCFGQPLLWDRRD